MEGIWIIIFIIAMLFQIFKKIGEVKTDLPKGRQGQELPPIFSEGPLPWEMDEPEDEGLGPLARQETERPDSARETAWADKLEMGKNERTVPQSGGKEKEEQTVTGEFLPLMDSYNIVNGIIMSELLQPPKSKRRISRNF